MARIGWTVCGCCGNPEASVSETKTGTLSITCHRCEFSAFAKPRTKAQRLVAAQMVRDQDDDAPDLDQLDKKTATAKQKLQPKTATAAPVEVKKVTSSVFSLGDL